MRKFRTELEEHFLPAVKKHVAEVFEAEPDLDPEQTDAPDALFLVEGKRVAVELSQIPSSYFMRRIKPRLPAPTKGSFVVAERQIYPFEPHRWVFDAIQEKKRRIASYRKTVEADGCWLALHAYKKDADAWPLSKRENAEKRDLELLLLRFGAQPPTGFDRVIYVYPEGTVAELAGPDIQRVLHIQSSLNGGYPSAVQHRMRIKFDVPMPGEFPNFYEDRCVKFKPVVVRPSDRHLKNLKPKARIFDFGIKLVVTHVESRLWVSFNLGPWQPNIVQSMAGLEGRQMDLDICFQGDIKDFDYNISISN